MHFALTTIDEAAQALQYFRCFHDAFVQSLTVSSRDRFKMEPSTPDSPARAEDIAQVLTGKLDVEIRFAHYNYAGASGPEQIVTARFLDVSEVLIDLRTAPRTHANWDITAVIIRQSEPSQDRGDTSFILELETTVCEERNRWVPRTSRLFRFRTAVFDD
jgi:hypothetical protein